MHPLRKLNVCHKTYYTKHILYIRNCTNDSYSHSSKLQSTRTTGLTFTPKHSSILPPSAVAFKCLDRLYNEAHPRERRGELLKLVDPFDDSFRLAVDVFSCVVKVAGVVHVIENLSRHCFKAYHAGLFCHFSSELRHLQHQNCEEGK